MRSGLECRNRSHTASASGVVILQTTIRISDIWSVFSAKTILTVSSREVVSSTTGRITDTRKESALIVIRFVQHIILGMKTLGSRFLHLRTGVLVSLPQ